MPAYPRYAVYYAPEEDSALWTRGSAWLGRDAASGAAVAQPVLPGLPLPELTDSPRRYGLHATVKAPFHLAEGRTEAELLAAVADFAAAEAAFDLPPLTVGGLGRFLALVPGAPCPPLAAMAERCVRGLDAFRAPPSGQELARRRPDALPPREHAYLLDWGYPYVLDAYRFHITLSDSIDDATMRGNLLAAARDWFARACGRPVPVRGLCVFVQDRPKGPFLLKERFRFSR